MSLKDLEKTQKEVSDVLLDLVRANDLPNALLFCGPAYSGRMYASRALIRNLGVPDENVIIVSDRNHSQRIRTALKLLKKNRNNSAKAFARSSIETLLMQYHGCMMDSQGPAAKKRFTVASEVSDLLRELDVMDEKGLESFTDKLEKAIEPLLDSRVSSISISQVRSIRDWCSTSSMDGQMKFAIIEGLENASDGAINALLKTLEEPPRDSHFILISSNAGRIPATILSRARKLRFNELDENARKLILSSLFVNPNEYDSLSSFFISNSGVDDELLKSSARALLYKQDFNLPLLVQQLEKTQSWDRFFSLVLENIRLCYLEGRLDQRRCQYLCDAISGAVTKGETFNQTKRLVFDFVIYRIMEVNK